MCIGEKGLYQQEENASVQTGAKIATSSKPPTPLPAIVPHHAISVTYQPGPTEGRIRQDSGGGGGGIS